MARKLTPERQKLKQEALSLRYDYGLSVPKIMRQLNLRRPTIYRYLSHNSHSALSHNNSNIQHLEGDCWQIASHLNVPRPTINVWLANNPKRTVAKNSTPLSPNNIYYMELRKPHGDQPPMSQEKVAGILGVARRTIDEWEGISNVKDDNTYNPPDLLFSTPAIARNSLFTQLPRSLVPRWPPRYPFTSKAPSQGWILRLSQRCEHPNRLGTPYAHRDLRASQCY